MSIGELRIVLFGRSGVGKSRSGNTILGTSAFKFAAAPYAVTKKCAKQKQYRLDTKIVVIDTPATLYDTIKKTEIQQNEIKKLILMSFPGPHIFVFCIQMDRITDKDINTLDYFSHHFGEEMLDFVVIMFTHYDNWIESMQDSGVENPRVSTYIEELPNELKSLISKCGYITVNNRLDGDAMSRQQESIIKELDRVVHKNGGKHFSNAMYKDAFQMLHRSNRHKKYIPSAKF